MKLQHAKQAPKVAIPSQLPDTKSGVGRPKNPTITRIMGKKKVSRATAYRVLTKRISRKRTQRERLEGETFEFSSLIKPSDAWNFNDIFYERIEVGEDGHGYIPGEFYANALFYFTSPGDLVVAPMAGSGQIQRVYDDRALWMKPKPWDIDLRLFDLTPRGPYQPLIGQHDMLAGFPTTDRPPDYVIMDVPYFGACISQYSSNSDDIANMALADWTAAMQRIAVVCAEARAVLATVIVPNWTNHDTGETVLCTEIVREAWVAAGYRLHRRIYASRHIQWSRADRIAVLNNRAKRLRLPLNDMSEVLTFRRAP